MKICHTADTHLGAGDTHSKRGESGLTLRQEDIINSFIEAVDKIIEIKPDVCIHAGDIFHVVRPTNKIIAIAGEQLHRIAEVHKIPTVIISGNHDAPKQPTIGAALDIFSHIDNLYISAGIGLKTFEIGDTKFFAIPHCLTTKIQKEELTKCVPDKNFKYNILIMHGVAAGMEEFSMADLGEQELPLKTMEQFDYTALGHFHNYCKVAHRSYYSGSTERLSQSERDAEKGFIVVDLDEFNLRFEKVKSRVMVDIQPINAAGKRGDQLAQLIKQEVDKVGSSDKIVRLKVQGVSEETLKTLPTSVLADLKQKSFSLNIAIEKEKSEETLPQFGKSGIGRIDEGFLQFLDLVDLSGFDKEKLKQEAIKYLAEEESI
ncbi:MAG: exonuclease SbcCD subunit D [Calditrichaeota bacterium]|nr:MAG: exonuclease SbcCD subunit D [Calditrichota bacterium]